MLPTPTASAPAHDPRAWITPEDLNVAPQLLGLPLATPRQRALAMAIDLALLALVSELGNVFLLVAFVLLMWPRLRRGQPVARRRLAVWVAIALLLALAAQQLWDDLHQRVAAPAKARAAASAPAGDADEADDIEAQLAASAASAGARDDGQRRRIAELEDQLAEARKPRTFSLREEVRKLLDAFGLSYAWALAYFSLLPLAWPGQTPGKRLLGLQVVELTGKPLTLMTCVKRYGGYAAGIATGMMGFVQIFWDANRQTLQDKTAHTVVINTRDPRRLALDAAANDET
ncbi:MAG: RDD family protein [Burkholderiaceae bacterium]|nr:RDD family protein [Burkholderiaceae bacterium]